MRICLTAIAALLLAHAAHADDFAGVRYDADADELVVDVSVPAAG